MTSAASCAAARHNFAITMGAVLISVRQDHRQVLTHRIDPKLIMANAILQQNSVELAQQIENELMENPALDVIEDSLPCKGDCVDSTNCPFCSQRNAQPKMARITISSRIRPSIRMRTTTRWATWRPNSHYRTTCGPSPEPPCRNWTTRSPNI